MPEYPAGIITLVFTDIQGSSDLWERYRSAFQPVLQEHNRLLREAARQWNGVEVKTEGDAFFLVFARASDAICFARDAQLALKRYDWPSLLPDLEAIKVRMGVHTGEPILSAHPDGTADYFGPAVNRAARVGGAGHGGQVVISDSSRTLALAELTPELSWLDLGLHRLKGVGEERLWQLCHADLPNEFPALTTLNSQRHNLPLSPTSFIGREGEIEQILERLRQADTRLLTILGFGGLGKTRLALQVAELCADDFADGVWWVELETARSGDDMVTRIASTLRLHLHPQPTVREQLWNFHRDRRMLLALDNLEQIPDAPQVVNELLKAAPHLKVLVTTRLPLELAGERRVEIRPLPGSDAQALFAERARSRQTDFELTDDNRADVTELCLRLEGVPLAIELAASRITGMTPREILARLDEPLRLLQSRSPDLTPRQRALRGAIDWSVDLLTEDDKLLFAQLSVFAGGFSMTAAEAVCEAFDVFEGVMELRRHSLLRGETDAGQQTRYAMLESVRSYARERLDATPQGEAMRRRHADYFLRFAQERVARLNTRDEIAALEQLSTELDNLRSAFKWASQAGQNELAGSLALCLHYPLYRRGFWDEALERLQKGLDAVPETASANVPALQAIRAQLLLQRAGLDHDRGDYPASNEAVKAALALFRVLQDEEGQADGLNLLGLLSIAAQRLDVARTLFEKSLSLRAASDHHGRAVALHNLARLAMEQGDMEKARQLADEALTERRAAGAARGEAETLGECGVLAYNSGDLETARRFYQDSLAIRRTTNDRLGIALMLYNLAEIAEAGGGFWRAIVFYVHAGRIFRDLQSVYACAPDEALAKLQSGLENYAALRARAEGVGWEDLIN